MMDYIKKPWILSAILLFPMVIFFLGYLFNHAPGLTPTGFIQHDNVSYIAFAKQYLDSDQNSFFYNNPFNESDLYLPIYFQPQTLLFALLLTINIPPAFILIPFTLLCSLGCFRILIAIYDHLVPSSPYRVRNLWLFAWGGGLLTITGSLAHFFQPTTLDFFDHIFLLDPGWGWWGLNFGRSLFFSCEAYYHLLFLAVILSILKSRWVLAALLSTVLSLSHPFTGIEIICILCLWCFIELIIKEKRVPTWFTLFICGLLALHIGYYLFYLNQFADHASVSKQYTLTWRLRFFSMIPAYALVATLALVSIWLKTLKNFFASHTNRLFVCWFAAAFLLANHELFITARQPIHFTRGYIWTSLFLLGLPGLQWINEYIKKKWKVAGTILFVAIFLSDNFLWIINNVRSKATETSATYISQEEKEVLNFLHNETDNQSLIFSTDINISYLGTVYTKAYPWTAHPFTTPFVEYKNAALSDFVKEGKPDSTWLGRNVVFVINKEMNISKLQATLNQFNASKRFETKKYLVIKADDLKLP